MDILRALMLAGLGGFIGSALRFLLAYFIDRQWNHYFPWGTLAVNVLGCFAIGILYGLWIRGGLDDTGNRLWITGFCGGFTTFSTFSADALRLLQQAHLSAFMAYVAGSMLLGFLATFVAMQLVKSW